MKTIKIYLGTNGSITTFDAPSWVNQYSYNDTLINVYVPSELIPPLDNEYEFNSDDELVSTTTYTYGIQMAMNITQANGTQKLGNNYNFKYVKDGITINGVEYTLYERKMPLEFTMYSGTQTYGISVVSYKNVLEVGETTPTTYTIGNISSYSFDMTINSALNIVDNPIETETDLSTLIAQVNSNTQALSNRQSKTDSDINVRLNNGGSAKTSTVVNALNRLDIRTEENYEKNITQDDRLDINEAKIATLEQKEITGFRYLGTLSSNNDPDATTLTNYVENTLGETLTNGDIVVWTKTISGATDVSYQCLYGYDGWTWTTIPAVELATNYEAGLIQGATSATANGVNAFASIVGGKIQDIFYLQNGNYYSITDIGNNKTNIADIANGTTIVGKSMYATYDSSEIGNASPKTIANKYLTTTGGATKDYVKNYALPRQFNDVYRLELNSVGFSTFTTEPTYSTQDKSVSISGIGEYILDCASLSTGDYTYQLSSKNSFTYSPLIYFNNDVNDVSIIVRIYDDDNNDIAIIETETYDFTANTYKKIVISDYLNQLGNNVIDVESDSIIYIELSVKTSETPENNTTAHLMSVRDNLATTFSLSTNSYTIVSSTSGIVSHLLQGVYDSDNKTLTFEMGNLTITDNSQHIFMLTSPAGYTFETLPSDTQIIITLGGVAQDMIFTEYTNTPTIAMYRGLIDISGYTAIIFTAVYKTDGNYGSFFVNYQNMMNTPYYVKNSDIVNTISSTSYELKYDTIADILKTNTLVFTGSQIGLSDYQYVMITPKLFKVNGSVAIYHCDFTATENNNINHYTCEIKLENGTAILTYILKTLVDTNTFTTSLATKQDNLTAGTGIDITSNVVSVDTSVIQEVMSGSSSIDITSNTISVNESYIDGQFLTDAEMTTLLSEVFN